MSGTSVAQHAPDEQQIPCRVCSESKPLGEFYNKQVRKDMTAGECKACTKERVRHRARTDPKVQEYDRARAKLPHRRANSRKVTKKWRAENPDGYKAHSAVSNALRAGRLKREPCMFCEADEVHAHHKDYSKPLEVVWLCPKCHHRLHATFPETEGANKGASA